VARTACIVLLVLGLAAIPLAAVLAVLLGGADAVPAAFLAALLP
jgi:hypothetical protein